MEQDIKEALEYLNKQGYGSGTNYSSKLVAVLIANYHQYKLKNNSDKNSYSKYEIDFGNHLRAGLQIKNDEVEIIGAVNGWGDNVPLSEVLIKKIDNQ
jgi:hypothetical protein